MTISVRVIPLFVDLSTKFIYNDAMLTLLFWMYRIAEVVAWVCFLPAVVIGLFKVGEHPWEVFWAIFWYFIAACLFSLGRVILGTIIGHQYGGSGGGGSGGSYGSSAYIGYGDAGGGNCSGSGDCG